MAGHDSGTGYPKIGSWSADRGRVLHQLTELVELTREAAKDVRAQERKQIEIETRLGERSQDITDLEASHASLAHEQRVHSGKHSDFDRDIGDLKGRVAELERKASDLKRECAEIESAQKSIRQTLVDVKKKTEELEKEQKGLSRLVAELNARSVIALGGGGAAGGGVVAGVVELIRHMF